MVSTLLGEDGVYLDEILLCSHAPNKKGLKNGLTDMEELIDTMAQKYNIDLTSSWLISYTEMGLYIAQSQSAGMHTALVLSQGSGEGSQVEVRPELICSDFYEAVQKILKREDK